jgi:AcrR family transcriptional regulator
MEMRREETAARRRRLLEAAIEVLGELGAERLTMEAVAERADIATRTLYNHFASRDELIAQAFALLLNSYREDVQLQVPETGDAVERLGLFVELLYGIYAQRGASLTTLLGHRDDPAIDAQVREMRSWRRGELEQILKSAKADLRISLSHAVALAFVSTNHATWAALVDECGLTPAKAVKVTTDALRAALFGTPAA